MAAAAGRDKLSRFSGDGSMGEAKRRKDLRAATHLPAPDILAKADRFNAPPGSRQLASSDRTHLAGLRRDCRKQSRKALQKARSAGDRGAQGSALTAILLGTNFTLEKQLKDFYEGDPDGKQIKQKIACSMGCSFCCHVAVQITIVEAIAVAMRIQANDTALIDSVKAAAPVVAGMNPEARLAKKIPCPLLRKGLCSIHEYRPLKCRALLSFDYKPCEATLKAGTLEEQSKIQIPRFGLPNIIEPAITEGIRLACSDEGLQSCTVELTAALNLIFSDATAVDRWLAGEAVFQPYS
jgi:Fe-S-cluster containining protein